MLLLLALLVLLGEIDRVPEGILRENTGYLSDRNATVSVKVNVTSVGAEVDAYYCQ